MRYFIYLLLCVRMTALVPFSMAATSVHLPKKSMPNVVVIMADDVGLGDISYHVERFMKLQPAFETPALDALAQKGMWFTDGHSATSLCSPTRYCVMSGNNNYRSHAPWGVWNTFAESPFGKGDVTLGSVVRDAGYTTGFIGKWHLGGDFKAAEGSAIFRDSDKRVRPEQVDLKYLLGGGPLDCGFDYGFTLPCGIQGPVYTAYQNGTWYPMGPSSRLIFLDETNAIHPKDITSKGPGAGDSNWDTREIGKLISAKAVDFIDAHAGTKPFFLYYCSPMPHLPHCPPQEFDGRAVAGSTPSLHLDCVVDLDCQVARILGALKKNQVLDDTLIIFMSDNGGLVNIDPNDKGLGYNSAGGWAGGKNSPLEGGHRTPFIAFWPGRIEAGSVCDELVVNTDILTTLAALVGTQLPSDQAMDSRNVLPLLLGQQKQAFRKKVLLQAGSNCEVIYRRDPWKLIIKSNWTCDTWTPQTLFDLKKSPKEQPADNQINNPIYQELVEELLNEYLEIRRSGVQTAFES
jgi:arylsulfatase A-like enzyme